MVVQARAEWSFVLGTWGASKHFGGFREQGARI